MFNIAEKFITISGEAPIIGYPVYLIRFSGCNLNCTYCDTPYKDEINFKLSINELAEDIISQSLQYPDIKVLFTGGEPFLDNRQTGLIEIIKSNENIDFYIETNGSIKLEDFIIPNVFYVADWKTPSSGDPDNFFMDNLKKFRINNDCLKFVVSGTDFDWLKEKIKIIQKINPFLPIYISPQWNKLDLEELAEFILKNRLPVRISIQLHKIIWKNKDRGV
jgi:7-carboxy-7-deazaguanine synthase